MATVRDKFVRVMRHGDVSEGFPVIEFGPYWDLTYKKWLEQGLSADLKGQDLLDYFGLDTRAGAWLSPVFAARAAVNLPPDWRLELPMIHSEAEYDRIRPTILPKDPSDAQKADMTRLAERQASGDIWVMIALDGPFWFPRMLLGVEPHLYAFYEQATFMKRMIDDLIEFNLRALQIIFDVYTPDVVCFAEDMCYRSGSMISADLFEEFLAPHYRAVVPEIRKRGVLAMVDSDGQLEPVIPWFRGVGVEGMSPLERQAGVDVNRIRRQYPTFAMSGGFDKMAMDKGEEAMRAEFERIRPAVLAGYYIPTEDHQVPPAVSLEDYRLYTRLLREFSEDVARQARLKKAT